MSRNGSSFNDARHFRKTATGSRGVTRTTIAPPLLSDVRVLLRKFMPVLTVRLSLLLSATCSASRSSIESVIGGHSPRWGHNLIKGKASLRASHDCVSFHSRQFGQLRGFILHTINRNDDRVASVHLLFKSGGPSAIFRAVSGAVVNPIQAIANWPWPHVSYKLVETSPLWAYRDTSPAVIFPLLVRWVKASGSHAYPTLIKWVRCFKRHEIVLNKGYCNA